MIWNKIKEIFNTDKKKSILGVSLFASLVVLLIPAEFALAYEWPWMEIPEQLTLIAINGALGISGLILGISGTFLNETIRFGVLEMGNVLGGGDENILRVGWTIFRDIVNIFFIFGLLYIAIRTIFDGWSPNTNQMLGKIIIAGLLINFSFFFTSVLIDASNVLSSEIYKSMETCIPDDPNDKPELSECFMDAMRTQTVHANLEINKEGEYVGMKDGGSLIKLLTGGLVGSVFIIITAVIFAAAAFMILSRFVILLFLLVTSPLMFAGSILPQFKKLTDDWYGQLVSALISLPVFFILLYITYRMLVEGNMMVTVFETKGTDGTLAELMSSKGTEVLGVFINFVVIGAFLVMSIVMSKKLAGSTAGMVTSAISKGSGKIVFGGAAKAGRSLGGRAGRAMSKSKVLNKIESSKIPLLNNTARGILRGSDKMAKGNWDARTGAAKTIGKVPGVAAVLKQAKFDLGKAEKTSYDKRVKDQNKKEAADEKLFKTDTGADAINNFMTRYESGKIKLDEDNVDEIKNLNKEINENASELDKIAETIIEREIDLNNAKRSGTNEEAILAQDALDKIISKQKVAQKEKVDLVGEDHEEGRGGKKAKVFGEVMQMEALIQRRKQGGLLANSIYSTAKNTAKKELVSSVRSKRKGGDKNFMQEAVADATEDKGSKFKVKFTVDGKEKSAEEDK